jgi:hypothetical protein
VCFFKKTTRLFSPAVLGQDEEQEEEQQQQVGQQVVE